MIKMKLVNEIGIAISPVEPVGVPRVTDSDQHCSLVRLAREGRTFYACNEDISCPLARFNLGSDSRTDKNLSYLAKTLVDWGDAENETIARRYLENATTLEMAEKYICYFPISNPKLKPDVVIKIGSPEELMPLVRAITRFTGQRTPGIVSGVGAMCGECTAIPLVTGQPNVSLGCGGSRPHARLDQDQLLLALPFKVYHLLKSSIRNW